MFKKIVLISIVVTILLGLIQYLGQTKAQNPPASISGKFYKFYMISENIDSGTSNYDRSSINNSGIVAFVGREGIADHIFTRNVTGH